MDEAQQEIVLTFSDQEFVEIRRLADVSNISAGDVIHMAVAQLIERTQSTPDGVENPFGLWKRRGLEEDGLAFQERVRAEW